MTMGPAPRIMIDLMSVRFLMAPPVVQASKGAATAGMADDDEGGKFIVSFIFLGGGDDDRRLLGCCCLLALSPFDGMAATTERPRPAVRALAAAARGWRAAIGGKKVEGERERKRKGEKLDLSFVRGRAVSKNGNSFHFRRQRKENRSKLKRSLSQPLPNYDGPLDRRSRPRRREGHHPAVSVIGGVEGGMGNALFRTREFRTSTSLPPPQFFLFFFLNPNPLSPFLSPC